MKYKNRAAAPPHLLTITELKRQRMKPAPDQWPAAEYWQGFHYVSLYDPAGAVPMRALRALTTRQRAALAAGRALAGTAFCRQCGDRFDRKELDRHGVCTACVGQRYREEIRDEWRDLTGRAARLLDCQPLFLDTETTGLDDGAEIVEIAILDAAGAVLLDTLVKPLVPITPGAIAIHGITNDDVAAAPGWSAIAPQVAAIVAGRLVIAHNASFDRRLLAQTCTRHAVEVPDCTFECTMQMLTWLNGGRWPNLVVAAGIAGAELVDGPRHRARQDAEMCRRILVALVDGKVTHD